MNPNPIKAAGKLGRKQLLAIILILVVAVGLGAMILRSSPSKPAGGHGDEHGHSEAAEHADEEHHGKKDGSGHAHGEEHVDNEHHEGKAAKGPHGGQRFSEGDFSVEILLAEEGSEPRFKAWFYDKDKVLPATAAKLSVTLTRPGGDKQEIAFAPAGDGLVSTQPVAEPHVFEATLAAQTATEPYLFTFSQQEGKVAMSDAQVKATGITLDTSGAAPIRTALQFPGEIRFNEDRTAHVVPRVTGVVESVPANLGQQVRKGQVLAVISSAALSEQRSELQTAQRRLQLATTTYEREKKLWEEKISPEQDVLQARQSMRESEIAVANAQQKLAALGASASGGGLARYELRAPFDGTIVEKHISLGESVKEDANVFTISDLSTVWAEFSIGAQQLPQVRVGETVAVRAVAFDAKASGTIAYVGSLIGEQTRTARARVTLANPQLAWRPGLFVNVDVVTEEAAVPVSVSADALQTVDDKPVIFLKVEGGFIPQPVQTGRSDGKRVEIVAGLQAGARYAAAGSFIVKSEQGKGSATHTH